MSSLYQDLAKPPEHNCLDSIEMIPNFGVYVFTTERVNPFKFQCENVWASVSPIKRALPDFSRLLLGKRNASRRAQASLAAFFPPNNTRFQERILSGSVAIFRCSKSQVYCVLSASSCREFNRNFYQNLWDLLQPAASKDKRGVMDSNKTSSCPFKLFYK